MESPSTGPWDFRGWSASGTAVEYFPLPVRSVLRQEVEGQGPWHWSVNPYQGCELGCTFCRARLDRKDFGAWRDFEARIGVKVNAPEVLAREIRAVDFEGRQVVLGTSTEPWQPAEERFRLTRALLSAMARVDGVDLRVSTRSSLIARDSDLLREIARRGQVMVAFSLASLDERVNRLLEPKAPSAFRRLAAMEALARAGIHVGLLLSPALPGLAEEEPGLAPLLARAASAGARFAGLQLLSFGPGQRERFLAHVSTAYPAAAARIRGLVGLRPPPEEGRRALADAFESACGRVGLLPLEQALPRQKSRPPAQLPVFR
jgi:DNA repair photolyase